MAGRPGRLSLLGDVSAEAPASHEGHEGALWVLTLVAYPWGRFHSRDLHKTNAAWASYPVLPPTGADGALAAAAGGERWLEGNFQAPRQLRDEPAFSDVSSLGAYPEWLLPSRTHYRAHVESRDFNYEAHAFYSGQGVGKKIAGVQDTLCDRLLFRAVAGEREQLGRLHEAIRGRVIPFGKKSMLQFAWQSEPDIAMLVSAPSRGGLTLAAVPVLEIGSMPTTRPSHLAVSSTCALAKDRSSVRWQTVLCVWEPGQLLRAGVPVWQADDGREVSASLVAAVRQA